MQVLATASVPSLNLCPDMIFIDGLQNDSSPSNGVGGSFPGNFQRSVFVNANLGTHEYFLYIPGSYDPAKAMPMLIGWHGVAGAGNAAGQAQAVRSLWSSAAETYGFIVVAQVATGSVGQWVANDQYVWAAIMDDVESHYNIETSRRYLWGFSAGGHWMHALALLNSDIFAGYGVSSGTLGFALGSGIFPVNTLRKIPVFVSIGDTDLNYPDTINDRTTFLQSGWVENKNYWLDEFLGGHTVPNVVPQKAWNKLCISTILD